MVICMHSRFPYTTQQKCVDLTWPDWDLATAEWGMVRKDEC